MIKIDNDKIKKENSEKERSLKWQNDLKNNNEC
jgi:hypothetical protein